MSVPSRAANDPKARDKFTLKLANEDYHEARQRRVRFAQYAREAGLTNQEIGNAYGITEAAVRQMLKRAAK